MTQTSPETMQVDPDVEEQDQLEAPGSEDAPRVYVVASDEHGNPLGGSSTGHGPEGIVSVPAALLGAGEAVSATAMTAAHLAGPGAAVAAVAALGVATWGVRAHRAAATAAGRDTVTSGRGGRETRRTGHPGSSTGRGTGAAGRGLSGGGRGRAGSVPPRNAARTTGTGTGAKRAGRMSGVKAGAARARQVAGVPGRTARRAELAAARKVGGHTQAAAKRVKSTPLGRSATTAARRAKAGTGRIVDAGRRAGKASEPARRRMAEAKARSREKAQVAADRRRAIRKAVRRQDNPTRKAGAARRAAREFDKRQDNKARRAGHETGRVRRARRWVGSHTRALGRGAWTLASRAALAGMAGLGRALLRRLGITWRPTKHQDDEDQGGDEPTQDREDPDAKAGDDSKPEKDNTPRRGTQMDTTTGSEFGQLLEDLAGQMATAAAAYDPETMPVWAGDIQHLGAALNHVATAISVLHAKTNDLPIEASVADTLGLSISMMMSAAHQAEETASTFRVLHAPDLERHEAPRPAEEKWNV